MSEENPFKEPRNVGIGLIVLALLLLTWTAYLGWYGTAQWIAVEHIEDGHLFHFAEKPEKARIEFDRALEWVDYDSRIVVPALNPREDIDSRIASLLPKVDGIQIRHAEQMRAFSQVLRGKQSEPPGSDSNARLIAHIADLKALARGPLPEMPSMDRATDRNLLVAVLETRLQAAWRIGDGRALVDTAGMMVTLHPRHPIAPYCKMLSYLDSPNKPDSGVMGRIRALMTDKQVRARVLVAASKICEWGDAALKHIDRNALTPKERRDILLYSNAPLAKKVDLAINLRDNQAISAVATMCLAANRLDLVANLAKAATGETKKKLQTYVEDRRGGEGAKVRMLTGGYGYVSFHVVTDSGIAPRVPVQVQIDGNEVLADDSIRFGSLFYIKAPGKGRVRLTVSIDGKKLHDGEIER